MVGGVSAALSNLVLLGIPFMLGVFGQPVAYAHVKEPRLFEMLDEVYQACNCHLYENLTGEEAMSEIAAALDSVISEGATGAIQHVTLPVEEAAPPAAPCACGGHARCGPHG